MGYQQGLSGLAAASNDLDVIGNNIANANTVGFKQSTAQFQDVYANTLASSVNTQIGLGASLSEVQQDFSQGTITTTGQSLDVAINGSGFFQMSDNGSITYSRNGVFQLDPNGDIVNAQGLQLMGYAANASGVINTASTVPLQVPTTNLAPQPTANVDASVNLNAQQSPPATTPFSESDSTSYNYSTSAVVYDSLGGKQTLNVYYVMNSTGNWDVYAGTAGNATQVGSMQFDQGGNLTSPTDGKMTVTVDPTDGAATNQQITINVTGTTQYGSANGPYNVQPDGYATGQLTGFTVGADGTLTGQYSNGQTQALGQIVLATFNNPNGLHDLGGNEYAQTSESGAPQVSTPGSTNHGSLTGGAIEASNVNLTNQLVDLITAQRNYQANAQTIKTQQTVDQTLLNL
ncbi:flagellar hook protein FlgE [Paraburkholderia caballeronis]|uniref:flagellar hook protein FlgE n=1 Tax=Paraburkholderia caballeronis TaxID=416943 RepID=UPI001064D6EE|nr:flagellar hook protein FlgE [Paraburkholderia caballeronis]TDV08057.1 flagellar hook protein FlgE [Paraburkholderia caballeronis]TDV11879.1 flagellar hook protein FlgE [Paraburkholderia caballeronis]TDV20349.1 flagellar hook protein FlgE [Paraburkholderia caballeronis]